MIGALGLAQLVEERRHHVVGAVEIDGERVVPVAPRVGVGHLAAADDAGVVDQHRNRPDLGAHLGGELVAGGAVGDVADKTDRVSSPTALAVRTAAPTLMSTETIARARLAAIAIAMASPIPEPAPVTSAIAPSSKPGMQPPPQRTTHGPAVLVKVAGAP